MKKNCVAKKPMVMFTLTLSSLLCGLAYAKQASNNVVDYAVAGNVAQQKTIKSAPLFLTKARFHALHGQYGVVVAQEARAANMGKVMLQKGGNAYDAAVATGFALMVTLPRAGALGGGGFMTIWDQKAQKASVWDYRESAPKAIKPTDFWNPDGSLNETLAKSSRLSAGVPGTVKALCELEKEKGSLGLRTVMNPAIVMAEYGITVTQGLAAAVQASKDTLSTDPVTAAEFKVNGHWLRVGDVWKRPDLAETLKEIRDSDGKSFYDGKLAKKIVSDSKEHGGKMTMADLRDYKVIERTPLEVNYNGYRVYTPPEPASGRVLVELLKLVSTGKHKFDNKNIQQNTAQEYHLLTEMMNYVYNDRNSDMADSAYLSDTQKKRLQYLVSDKHIQSILNRINSQKHTPSVQISDSALSGQEGVNTTQFSVVDKWGNMVSNTYSLNHSFGSGLTVTGTGILLNNTMDDFALKPGEKNSYGLVQGKINKVAGGKRPLSSMVPTIIVHNKRAWMATGSPGGSNIITAVFQLILNRINYQMDLATATEMPHIHSQLFPDEMKYEQGVSPDTLKLLRSMGHKVTLSRTIGSLQTVQQDCKDDNLTTCDRYGFADTRRLGAGVAVVVKPPKR